MHINELNSGTIFFFISCHLMKFCKTTNQLNSILIKNYQKIVKPKSHQRLVTQRTYFNDDFLESASISTILQ